MPATLNAQQPYTERYEEPETLKKAASLSCLWVEPAGMQAQARVADIPSNRTRYGDSVRDLCLASR